MKRLGKVVAGVMERLSILPGLSFLKEYVRDAQGMQNAFGHRTGDYAAYLEAVSDAGNIVRGEPGEGDEEGDGEFEDGSEPIARDAPIDYYDLYEDEETSTHASSFEPADDYPASDELNPYYDDDYRS